MGSFCIGTWGWGPIGIGNFTRSNIDTNLILGIYYVGPCSSPEGDEYNLISYNSGQTSYNPLLSQNEVMNSFDIDPVKDSNIYGLGANLYGPSYFWKSTDKGLTWSSFLFSNDPPYHSFLEVNALSTNEIIMFQRDTLRKSTNYGQNFFNLYYFRPYVKSIVIDDVDGSIYISSDSGLYKSTNGGISFQKKFNLDCYKILIDNDDHNILYVGVKDEGIYKSTNAGTNWRKYFDAFEGSRNIVGIIKYKNDGDTIYAANNKKVYKIWDMLVGISNNSNEIPDGFYLNQNYPNPFNPKTIINFQLSIFNYVTLKVFDALGRQVATLVNEKLSLGSYDVEFNGANYPSGIYYYKLEAGDFSEVKKMILLK
jgi:hypothetical protein